ncbi:hypothetical protein CYY_003398, partial [Polysphondylium violaceum]
MKFLILTFIFCLISVSLASVDFNRPTKPSSCSQLNQEWKCRLAGHPCYWNGKCLSLIHGTSDRSIFLESTSDKANLIESTSDKANLIENTSDRAIFLESTSDKANLIENTSDRASLVYMIESTSDKANL